MFNLKQRITITIFLFMALAAIPPTVEAIEVSGNQSIHVAPRSIVGGISGGDLGGFSLPNSVGGSFIVNVNHRFSTSNENPKPGDLISFSYTPDPPVSHAYYTGDVHTGKWCQTLDEQCLSFVPTGVQVINVPYSPAVQGSPYSYTVTLGGVVWSGLRPEASLVSSNNDVVKCPANTNTPLTCLVLKEGSATISLKTDLVPLKIWIWGYDLSGNLLVNRNFQGNFFGNLSDLFRTSSSGAVAPMSLFNAISWPMNSDISLFGSDFFLPDFTAHERGYRGNVLPIDQYLNTYGSIIDQMPWPLVGGVSDIPTWNHYYVLFNLLFFHDLPRYTGVDRSWLQPNIPFSELKAMDVAYTPGETFRQAIVKRYPNVVPVVSEFTPGNRSDTVFMPGDFSLPGILIVVDEPEEEDDNLPPNPPTVVPETPVEVGEYSTVTMTATDPDGDEIRYCIDWNMDGDSNDNAPNGMSDPEGCTAFVPSGTSRDTWQSWTTVGTKTFQVRTEDRDGLRSSWTVATVEVTTSGGNNSGSCGDGIKNGTEECDGGDFGGLSCQSFGFSQGSLSCRPNCSVNTSACSNTGGNSCVEQNGGVEICGNGIDEDCNGSDLQCTTSGPTCNKNTICERSRGENFFNCSDCRGIFQEF